jgi:hypothetical protein
MRNFAKILPVLTLLILAAGISGCQALAAALDKTSDPKEPALYVPDHVDTLVLIEDYQNPALVELLADHMDQLVSEELIANKAAPIINPEKLTLLRLDHPDDYRKMKIPSIGNKLGARQVIYANITDFNITSAGGTELMKGRAEARVKIVDCVTGLTRWPNDATTAGYPVVVEIPFSTDTQNVTAAQVREGLARALASKIARLFYTATVDQPDPSPKYPETDLQ